MAMVIKDMRLERKESDILVRRQFAIFHHSHSDRQNQHGGGWVRKLCLPYRVVPPRLILTVVGKQIHDELIDL